MEESYFSCPATLLKVTLRYGWVSRFLNCTNGTESCKVSQCEKSKCFIIITLIDCQQYQKVFYRESTRCFLNPSRNCVNKNTAKSTNKSNYRRCSIKKLFLKISQCLQENACVVVSFFNKVAGQRDSNTDVFL